MSQNQAVDSLDVFCNLRGTRHFVGKLAERNRSILFEYDKNFLNSGLELSPFKLPLRPGIFEDKERVFDGLPGVFNDSLPDGWGLLLLDRALRTQGVRLREVSPLQRLSMVGSGGMGAIEYVPSQEVRSKLPASALQLDGLAEESRNILAEGESSLEVVFDLLKLGGSSGGARPKILAKVSADGLKVMPDGTGGEGLSPWLIKFHASEESPDQGLVEYVYSLMAREAGIEMPETRLFASQTTAGFFGVRRFDREEDLKIHVHTAAGILHASHRHPTLDYENLLRLTKILTKDVRDVEKMVRLMVFNVKSGNRDDHSKNFSFMLDDAGDWKLAPAYDLTPSAGFNGEHSAMVNGKGRDITDADLIQAASSVDVPKSFVIAAIQKTEAALTRFEALKEEYLK
ncbi:MAG: type II toxin-antitoxin system HipA family toxin [Deltaproteobacteria bacterium]|jgi:serine/threonine-protein kinase HipA|nr:type II toxin-antitoxin system HipA family toxin [Deltaproteobacteria bacterium]